MGRLIDADAIVEYVRKYSPISDGADLLETWLEYAPTVDAVPVVRCEDCRFWSKYPGSSAAPQYHECMARMTHIGNLYTTAGEYCSRGERKDGDNHG